MEEENLQQTQAGNENVETAATPSAEDNAQTLEQPKERTYTKAEVQNLMRRRVERSHKAFFTRYGVNDLNGLDDLMNKSKTLGSDYEAMKTRNSDLLRENAFLKNNINPEKYDDIIAHFKGTNTDFSELALIEALKTHPEWLKQDAQKATTTFKKVGNEFHKDILPSEKERAEKLLGVKF